MFISRTLSTSLLFGAAQKSELHKGVVFTSQGFYYDETQPEQDTFLRLEQDLGEPNPKDPRDSSGLDTYNVTAAIITRDPDGTLTEREAYHTILMFDEKGIDPDITVASKLVQRLIDKRFPKQ